MKGPFRFLLLYKEWPVWVCLVMLYPLNMEISVMPFWTNIVGLSGLPLVAAAIVCTSVEISYWYWFVGWLKEWKKRNPIAGRVTELKKGEKNSNFVIVFFRGVAKIIVRPFNSANNHEKRKLFSFLKSLGYVGGCLVLFPVGIAPGFWFTGLYFCRTIEWRVGLCFLTAGNIIKNYFFGMAFSEIWSYLASLLRSPV